MNELIASLILAVLVALGGWVSKSLIPYIKARTTISQQEDINYWVSIAVSAAEQIYNQSGQGEHKLEYVMSFLRSRGLRIDDGEIRMLTESAVLRLKSGLL